MTTEQKSTTEKEIKKIRRVLKATGDMARHASLTGALSGGQKRAIQQYNNAVRRLQEIGAFPGKFTREFFLPLEEEASFDEVGVACSLFSGYLESDTPSNEIEGAYHLLKSAADLAQHASLTGQLRRGKRLVIRQHNAILNRLQETDVVPEGFFAPLEADAPFGEAGVACAQLAAYLEDEGEESGELQQEVDLNIEVKLKDLGQLVRQAMPDFLKENVNVENRIDRLVNQMKAKVERIRRERLSPDEIQGIVDDVQGFADEIQGIVDESQAPEKLQRIADEVQKFAGEIQRAEVLKD